MPRSNSPAPPRRSQPVASGTRSSCCDRCAICIRTRARFGSCSGLAHYRLGNYAAAAKELDAFVELTDSVEQHPVLMDAMRAMGKYRRVDVLWEELAAASPSSALVTEGRIVLAGTLADRGKVRDAIAVLDRRGADARRVQEHHLRLWYALADLYERAGEIPKARELFLRIRKHDAGFADVAERLAALR